MRRLAGVVWLGLALIGIACMVGHVGGCKQWTQQDTQVAVDVGTEILCAIEHAELEDPALDALCAKTLGPDSGVKELSPQARQAVIIARKKIIAARLAQRCGQVNQ